MPRWSMLAYLAAIFACVGCDRVFGVEGTPHSVDARGSGQIDAALVDAPTLDGAVGPYSDAVLADGPIAYYRLDELSGPVAEDSAGSVNGTYVGDLLYAQSPAVWTEPGGSPVFDQNETDNSGVLFGNDFAFDGAHPFALELWIFPFDDTNTFGNVISKWLQPPTSSGYIMYTDSGATLVFARDAAGLRGSTSAPINPSGWSHIVGSYDGIALTLSINGQVADSAVSLQALPTMTTNFVIGSAGGNTTTNPFRGQIDNVAIYDHALSPQQALAHYQAAGVAD